MKRVDGFVLAACVAALVALAGCGGEGRTYSDDGTAVAEDQPAGSDDSAASEPAEPEVADEGTAAVVEPIPEPQPTPEPTPTVAPEVAPADPTTYPLTGTVSINLSDGNGITAEVGCEATGEGETWLFRFAGSSESGVLIEGAYDASEPDFVILFVSGPEFMLTNVNGGDDLSETNSAGSEWNAVFTLTSPEGDKVDATVAATCGAVEGG